MGAAYRTGDVITLTPTGLNQVGAVWYQQKQAVVNGFRTRFQFRITDRGGNGDVNKLDGGDGIAFVIQNSSPMGIGNAGDGKGYDGIANCLAIEFDTFANSAPIDPPLSTHISVQTRWVQPNKSSAIYSLGTVACLNLDDDKIHTAIIDYQPGTLKVYVDDCSLPLLQVRLNIADSLPLLNGKAWVGLTAATATSFQQHDILQWRFNSAGIAVLDSGTCGKDSIMLMAPAGYSSYTWSTGETTQQIICRASGLYSVVCKGFLQPEYGQIDCNSIIDTFTTLVRLLPAVAKIRLTTNKPLPLCPNNNVIIQASSADTTIVFRWENQFWNSSTITVWGPGIYRVTGINAHGCVITDSIMIDTLKVNITIRGATSLCNGDTITLEADTGFASYRWSNGAPTRSIRVWKPGEYFVTATRADGCTVTSQVQTIEIIIPNPTITASGTSPICTGDSLILDAGAGYTSYRWSTGEQTQKITVQNEGRYVVEVTNRAGCYGYDTIPVTTLPQPFIDAGLDTVICAGDTVQLIGIGDGLLMWNNSSSLSCLDCPSPIATPQQTTTYYLQAVSSNRCTARDSITVTVLPLPSAVVSNDTAICAGGSAQLSASGGKSFLWSPSTGLSCVDCPNPIAMPAATTTYNVVTSNGGHCSDTASITVSVIPLPEVKTSNDTTICWGSSVMLSAEGTGPFRWQPNIGLSCDDCPNPIATPTTTTRYLATVTNVLGCTISDSVTVTVAPLPIVEAGNDQEICRGDSVQLVAKGTGLFSWWPTEGLRCSECSNPVAAPATTTTYRVTVTDQYGCTASDWVTVRVNPAPRILQTAIGQNIRGKIGGKVRVPVLINQDVTAIQATSLRVHLCYDTTIMRLNQQTETELQSATKGTLLEGWKIIVEAAGADSLLLFAETQNGQPLAGVGEILAPEFTLFLGSTPEAAVVATVTIPNAPCTQILPGTGLVKIDSLCGLNLRLIELTASNFSLEQNRPNPFNPVTSLPFSLGLDGHVVAEILDGSGNVVVQLINQIMGHGRYTIDWDATGYPSGIYYFRIRSGDWQRSIAMVVMK